MSEKKKEFVSDLTGVVWSKENWGRWQNKIDHKAILLEDYSSAGKNGTSVILPKDSEVVVDDIRGRIHPQYRVIDSIGRIWFVPIDKIEIISDSGPPDGITLTRKYRGGVREDHQTALDRERINKKHG